MNLNIPEAFVRRLKSTIFDWIGAVSVKELAGNADLGERIERLCKSLSMIPG